MKPDDLFDPLAQDYETMRRELQWDPFVHIHAAFEGRSLNGLKILDAGCGTGECTRWFQSQGADPVGLDISGEMCFLAAERSENILYLPHDLSDPLPFGEASFDAVVALGCLEYLEDIAPTMAEFRRVLRPGGLFLGCFERYGDDCPGGNAPEVVFLDDWVRYRQSREELQTCLEPLFSHIRFDRVPGFVLEESDERTQYWRVIAD